MFKNYLTIAIRNIKKYKGCSLINISGLAVGMACFILIFLYVYDEMHYDTFHTHADRLCRVLMHRADDPSDPGIPRAPYALPAILKEEFPEILETTRVRNRAYPSAVRYGDITFYENRFYLVDPSFFTMFTYDFVKGDPATALTNPQSVVLTEDAAARYFGDKNPMGKTLRWNNKQDLTITGVIKNVPYNSHHQFDFTAPIQLYGQKRLASWRTDAVAYVLLAEGTSIEDVSRKIAGTPMKYLPDSNLTISLQHISEAHLNFAQEGSSDKCIVFIFAVIAVLVLAIACVNFMNITTARSGTRAGEVGLRKVVGAKRQDIINQFLGEAILISFISLILAVSIVELILPGFNTLMNKKLSFIGTGNITLLMFLIAVAVVTGVIAGSYPAIYLSRFQPVKVLKNKLQKGRKGSAFRSVLVIGQFSVSVILIILTGIAQKQITYIRDLDLGFNRQQIIYMQMNDELREHYPIFKERLLRHPQVQNVTASSAPPHLNFNVMDLDWQGRESDKEVDVNFLMVDHDYIETFDLEIVKGRDFSREHPVDATEAFVVNESAVRFMGMGDPIGKRITLSRREGQIIGVVKDFHHLPLIFEITPLVMAIDPDKYYDLLIKISPMDISKSIGYIHNVFKDAAPNFPFRYEFMEDWFNRVYSPMQVIGKIFNNFALLAIFISCLGLFGLSFLLTEQKKKEIGIRKVLGDSVTGIVKLLSGKFLKTVLIANIIAVPLAYYGVKLFLGLFAYRTTLGVTIYLATAALTFVIAALTVSYTVIKTALTNPVDILRYE
ncbi:ABC transporter permease [Acidobacteriota bacterium]